MNRAWLTRYAWLSIAAALTTIALKTSAYFITGSVGLLSDAAESVVNLIGAVMALWMLSVAARPADEDHAYGHDKAEYFSSGVEGAMIFVAAIAIAATAVSRLLHPRALELLGFGLAISVVAALINFAVAVSLLRAGRKHNSIALEADARHLLTDVWTSAGVLAGVGLVALTGWNVLDPVVALFVSANILWTGAGILRRSILGLMDTALSAEDLAVVQKVLHSYTAEGAQFHALLTRQSGARKFVSVHVLVPGDWTVDRGHQLVERIEKDIRRALPDSVAFTHLESLDDPDSWRDQTLERERSGDTRRMRKPGS